MGSKNNWWSEDYGFFGDFYIVGDNSENGYLQAKNQNLNERTQTEVDGIIRLLELKDAEKILDVPCGYGRHSIQLIKRGFDVIGCDINKIHITKALNDAKSVAANVDFRQMDMIDIKFKYEFDAVINMFYSFGFFESDKDNLRVLYNFYTSLKPGGKFLMHTDVNIPRILNKKYPEYERRMLKGGEVLEIIDRYHQDTKRIEGTWVITNKQGEEKRKDYSVRVYTRDEFLGLCKSIGFKTVVTYGDWEGNDYSDDAEDMIIVATK